MLNFELITYSENQEYAHPKFFILNRGWNSGKPMDQPCPNCFVCICKTEECKHALYWITFTLWRAKQYHEVMRGSVIPFLPINEARKLISNGFNKVQESTHDFLSGIELVKSIEQKRLVVERQMVLLEQLKLTYLHNLLK